jgi:ribokinase
VASAFGVKTGFIDTYGNDDMAALKYRKLDEAGVDLSQMVRRDSAEDHIFIVYVHEATGERYFSSLPEFLSQPVLVEELDRDYITSADYLHLDCCHSDAGLQAAQWMHEAGKQVVLDAGRTNSPIPKQTRALVEETDVLICGSGFGAMLTGQKEVWDIANAILEIGPRVVVQTEGEDGNYTLSRDKQFHTPAFEVDIVDTTGAGDVFHGAYLVGLAKGWELERIARFSSAVSALHCTVLGNRKGIPAMDEVEEFLKARA